MALSKKKKRNTRIGNTARKTVASLCLVTALIVAAIPGDAISAMQNGGAINEEIVKSGRTVMGKGLVNEDAVAPLEDAAAEAQLQPGHKVVSKEMVGLRYNGNNGGTTLHSVEAVWKIVSHDHEDNDPNFKHEETHWDDTISANVTEEVFDEGTEIITYMTSAVDESKIRRLDLTGSGLAAIDKGSVENMKNLETLICPSTLTEIGSEAFRNHENLKSITGLTGLDSIGKDAFKGCQTLTTIGGTEALTNIGESAFEDCTSLSSFTPSENLGMIGQKAFKGCTALSSFNFPTTLRANGLGDEAFRGSGLSSVNIPDGGKLVKIPTYCFAECSKLRDLSVGGGVAEIGDYAFNSCPALSTVTLNDTLQKLGKYAFSECGSLGSFSFPAELNGIPKGILQGCTSLTSVNFNTANLGKVKYTEIPEFCFYDCASLEDLNLPDGISKINENSIRNCSSLKTMKFPASFSEIPAEMFDGCNSLEHVYVYNQDTQFPSSRNPFPTGTDVTIHGYNNSSAQTYAVNNGFTFVSLDDDSVQADFYTIDSNGIITAADTSRLLSYSNSVTIPDEVRGIKVTGIGPNVFLDNTRLTEVVFPATVKNIGERAFSGCTNLKTVRFNSDETTFMDNSFADTNSALTMHGVISKDSTPFNRAMERGITFTDDTYGIVVEKNPKTGENILVAYDEHKDTLVVPTGVDGFGDKGDGTAAGTSLFDGNTNLKSVQINGAKHLNDHLFKNCSNLDEVYLPATLEDIGIAPFYGCSSLHDMIIDAGNTKYYYDKGVIYEGTKDAPTAIVEALPGSNEYDRYTIPESVTKLYEEAFASPHNIGTVYFTGGVDEIPQSCFADSEIPEIYLTSAVHSVGKKAFADSDGNRPYLARIHVPNPSTVISDSSTDGVTGLTLYGKPGSTAQYYADTNSSRQYVFEGEENAWEGSSSSSGGPGASSSALNSSSGSAAVNSSSNNNNNNNNGNSSANSSSKKKASSKKKKKSSSKSSTNKSGATTIYQSTTVYAGDSSQPSSEVAEVVTPPVYAGNAGNTYVDTAAPGIDEHEELVSGSIDGGADNYVIKIKKSDEATREFEDALQEKYGNLENLRYYAMDISLYDSEGNNEIENTKGVDVTITIPIPEELALYGGNNHAAAVKDSHLEELGTRFSSIDGTPCVTFTAEHFSTYGLYVDVTNLSAGNNLDYNPKTGDPIAPKWFLVVGLAALSAFLFLKKEKPVAVRA